MGLACLGASLTSCASGPDTASPKTTATETETETETFQPHQDRTTGLTVDETYYGTGPGVALLGDSLTSSVHDEIHQALEGWSSVIASVRGEGLAGGPWTVATKSPDPIMVVAAERLAALTPDVVVIELGTNDAWVVDPGPPLGRFHDIVNAFGDACVVGVLVSVESTADGYDRDRAALINRAYRDTADVVVDILERPPAGVIGDDEIHLTPEGQLQYIDAIKTGIDACADLGDASGRGSDAPG